MNSSFSHIRSCERSISVEKQFTQKTKIWKLDINIWSQEIRQSIGCYYIEQKNKTCYCSKCQQFDPDYKGAVQIRALVAAFLLNPSEDWFCLFSPSTVVFYNLTWWSLNRYRIQSGLHWSLHIPHSRIHETRLSRVFCHGNLVIVVTDCTVNNKLRN